MAKLLGIVLPLALGAAVSPTIFAFQLLMLSRRSSPLGRAWAVAAGCALVLAALAVVALLVAGATRRSGHRSEAEGIVKLVAAALLVALAVRDLRKPPRPKKPEQPSAHPLRRAFIFGAGLMLTNFSSIVLFFPAMHQIGSSDVSFGGKALAFLLLYLITLVPAILPPAVVTLLGARATAPLERLNQFFVGHQRAIAAALCFGFAVVLTATGVSALA